jgi:hypothetical protein
MQRIPEKKFQNPVPKNTGSRHRNCEKKEQAESQRKVVRLHQTKFSLGLYRILKHRSYREEEKKNAETDTADTRDQQIHGRSQREKIPDKERKEIAKQRLIASAFLSATTCEEERRNSVWPAGWRKPSA